MSVHVAFLRGVNVGGKHSLPMAALAALFTESGCGEVRTCIQSGNVLFTAGTALARRIPALIAAGISKRFGFEAPVVTRTAAELAAIAKNNPFLRDGPDPKALHVIFLADPPTGPGRGSSTPIARRRIDSSCAAARSTSCAPTESGKAG